MKILMLTPYLPYPLLSGGQIRTYNLLKNLSEKHQITLFSFIRENNEKDYIQELTKYCQVVRVIKRRKAWNIKNILLAGFTPYPFLVSIYLSLRLKKAIEKELSHGNYDLIHAETFYVMPNIPRTQIPILLVEQTIEYMVYQNFVDNLNFWPIKPFLYFDVMKIKIWEKFFWRQATRLATMSEEDKEIIKKVLPGLKIDIVANGVDIDFFTKTEVKKPAKPTVLFVGNFKWLPNKDAACFLAYEIWPLIKKLVPEAKLWIVGRNPTPEIEKLADLEGVMVEGEVDDIRQVLGRASVLLAPIRNGRGTKYKVLESMATGLPVVTTPIGIEGIEAGDGREVLIAKTEKELARKTVEILKNPQKGNKIAKQAKFLVEKEYNWKKISRELDRIYQELGQRKFD